MAGDAAIYFTYIRNFFSLPFSFQPGTVSFGATAPLHVVVHAPLALIAGNHWLLAGQIANWLFVIVGIVVLSRSLAGDSRSLLLTAALTLLNIGFLISVSQLYETGLTFLAVAVLYGALKSRQDEAALLLAGLLYLLRPELLLVTAAVDGFILLRSERRPRTIGLAALSLAPAAAYHLYMFSQTGQWLPSSVCARAIASTEEQRPWGAQCLATLGTLRSITGISYLLGLAALAWAVVRGQARRYAAELLIVIPILLLYLVVPPRQHLLRYWIPILPALVAAAVRFVDEERGLRVSRWALSIGLVTLHLYSFVTHWRHPKYDYDTLLLRDLAEQLNPLAAPEDRVLLYEMQGQCLLNACCLSLDGIVGNQLLPALTGRERFEDVLRKQRVKFVVTANALNYRRVYRGTLMEQLYLHDLTSQVSDTVTAGGLAFRKILTNRAFADPACYREASRPDLNVGATVRLYGPWNRLWEGHPPMWNSVYEVIR